MQEFGDFVTLKSRVDHEVAITFDSRARYVQPGRKGLTLPREIAELGIKQHAFRWDPGSGAVVESRLYIVEDQDGDFALPDGALDEKDVAEVKETDGLGEDSVLIDGAPVKKRRMRLKASKEDFSINNR